MLLSQVFPENFIESIRDGVVKNWLDSILPGVIGFFWNVVLALVTVYVGVRVIRLLRKWFRRFMERHDLEEGLKQFLDQVVKYLLYIGH